jgi:LysM repeat protein
VVSPLIIPSAQAPLPTTSEESQPSTGSGSTPPTTTGGPASSGHDTKVFGNLEGRDPDLLFAGEKIMINGKQVTVADGDTLSSLAAKHGTTVEKLIAENKMDASLLGQNGPNGAYFTPGGPQPAPGGVQNPPTNALAPAGANGTYTKEQVPALRAEVERLQKEGALAPDKATDLLGLLTKIENGDTLSASDATKLTSLMKDLKTAQANSTSAAGSTTGSANNGSPGTTGSGSTNNTSPSSAGPGSPPNQSTGGPTGSTPPNQSSGQNSGLWSSLLARDPQMTMDDPKLDKPFEKDTGLVGGLITASRVESLLGRIELERQNPNSIFSSEQLDRLVEIIKQSSAGDGGQGLDPVEKYAFNRFCIERKVAALPTDMQGAPAGSAVLNA